MPTLPTLPWAMEEPPLPSPAEILVMGGDAPAGGRASSPMTREPTAEPSGMGTDPRGTGGAEAEQAPVVSKGPATPSEVGSLPGPAKASVPGTQADGATSEPAGHALPPGNAGAGDPADPDAMPVGEAVPPVLDPPWDEGLPTLAALDAIRAAFAEDPPGLDPAARAELAALLGLDPALAAEQVAFLDALRDAHVPDGDALLAEWLSAARAAESGVGPAPAADWPFP